MWFKARPHPLPEGYAFIENLVGTGFIIYAACLKCGAVVIGDLIPEHTAFHGERNG